MNDTLATFLNEKAEKYNCIEFIKNDPIQFPHSFNEKKDVEIVACLASVIAWGNRKMIINSCKRLFGDIMNSRPYEYVMRGEWERTDGSLNIHRTFFMRDLAYLCRGLRNIYSGYDSLENIFAADDIWKGIDAFRSSLITANNGATNRHISNPTSEKGRPASACKRLNMMLRWLCRNDGIVDLGIWKNISPERLMIPLDVHVARISRELGLLQRKQNDRKSVELLTSRLRELSPNDPVKYDFALFGIGVEEKSANIVK